METLNLCSSNNLDLYIQLNSRSHIDNVKKLKRELTAKLITYNLILARLATTPRFKV